MKETTNRRRILGVVCSLAGLVAVSLTSVGAGRAFAQPTEHASYVRVVDEAESGQVRLEVAVRRFISPNESWPTISVAGAVHIGDRSFYEQLQHAMDAQDVVLFESVKPSGMGDINAKTSDETRVKITERRLRFLATILERQRKRTGELPSSLDDLAASMDDRFVALLNGARTDAWGNEIAFETNKSELGFELASHGSDGQVGGEGAASDLLFSQQKPLTPAERGESGPGVQKQLAEALGLVFQPEAMHEGGPTWRNSDMSVDQVQQRLEEEGVDGEPLFRMLSGESMAARFTSMLLRLISSNDQSRAMTKLMMIELLGSADQLLTAGPGDMGKMMKVIVNDRNEIVMADLRAILRDEPEIRTIGILYGAGHLADIETRLAEMGYVPDGDQWLSAMTVDLASAGLTPERAAALRTMMKRSIEQQMQATQRRR